MGAPLESPASVLQALSWFAGALGVGFGAWKYYAESREKRLWEKARLAKEMLTDLSGDLEAINASYMLGAWTGRWYEREENGIKVSFQATPAQVAAVLDPTRTAQSNNEQYVRQCFDELLYHLDLCAGAARSGLVEWKDVKPLFVTLFAGVERAMLDPLRKYAAFSRYYRAESVLEELVEAALSKPAPAESPSCFTRC
jgi:hypothetical protein